MATTRKTRSKATTPAEQTGRRPIDEYARSNGASYRLIGGVEVACCTQQERGETVVVQAAVELPGERCRWGGGLAYGIVQRGRVDGTCWMVSADAGWLNAEFSTLDAAVAALRDPGTRAKMREYSALVAKLAEAQREVQKLEGWARDFQIPGALPDARHR